LQERKNSSTIDGDQTSRRQESANLQERKRPAIDGDQTSRRQGSANLQERKRSVIDGLLFAEVDVHLLDKSLLLAEVERG
jgi:hypothetical protein